MKRAIHAHFEPTIKEYLDSFRAAVESGENERASMEAWGLAGYLFGCFGEEFPSPPIAQALAEVTGGHHA